MSAQQTYNVGDKVWQPKWQSNPHEITEILEDGTWKVKNLVTGSDWNKVSPHLQDDPRVGWIHDH